MKNVLIILLLILCSCEEPEDIQWPSCNQELDNYEIISIYIDNSCKSYHIEIVSEAVDSLNNFTNSVLCEPIIEIIGIKNISELVPNRYNQTIACYYSEPDWYTDYNTTPKGRAKTKDFIDIYFFRERMNDDYVKSLVMHELFHYIGIESHSKNLEDIMYTSAPWKTEYTEGDAKLFCEYYNCQREI